MEVKKIGNGIFTSVQVEQIMLWNTIVHTNILQMQRSMLRALRNDGGFYERKV